MTSEGAAAAAYARNTAATWAAAAAAEPCCVEMGTDPGLSKKNYAFVGVVGAGAAEPAADGQAVGGRSAHYVAPAYRRPGEKDLDGGPSSMSRLSPTHRCRAT